MMKEEFESRVGLQVTNREYAEIEKAYMTNEVDKDVFCQEWLRKLNGAEYKAMAERVIEPDEPELPPMAKGTLSNKSLMEKVFYLVKKMPEFQKAESIIDYMMPVYSDLREITQYEFDFVAIPNLGGSEGIYIDCYLDGVFDNSKDRILKMGTVKTLERSLEAIMIMGELAGLLTWVVNDVVNQQIQRGYFDIEGRITA